MSIAVMVGLMVQAHRSLVRSGNPYRITKAANRTGTMAMAVHRVGARSLSSFPGPAPSVMLVPPRAPPRQDAREEAMIKEALAGSRIGITGATGFLGTALVERLLRTVPDCELVLLVRPGRRASPEQRAKREIFSNDAFARLRADLGDGFDDEIRRRVGVVAGDVTSEGLGLGDEGREVLAGCRTVVHAAARVSFDSPLDAAVDVNLLGAVRVVETLKELGSPHLVTVSTAYVAGSRRGRAPEAPLSDTPFSTDVAWRGEVDAAHRARADLDAESRRPEKLTGFTKQARGDVGAAGSALISARAERLREDWVEARLVEAGRARAQALGWPDAYAYTKALAERAVFEICGSLPVTIVRPSIIESAWADPAPGWIRGFRMAEPVIIAYGRGLLSEFPGIPEGVIDVVPVDMVVATILAVAARGPELDRRAFHVATGSRNPLRLQRLVNLVTEYFFEHPLYDADGQPIVTPDWQFSQRGRAQRQLQRGVTALKAAERVITALPIRGRRAEVKARLEDRRDQGR